MSDPESRIPQLREADINGKADTYTGFTALWAKFRSNVTLTWPWARISDIPSTFTPATHASSHGSAGSDPVTPASIGAETTAQLNTRDTNNRARANHAGSQLASTISDFSTAADARITAQKAVAGGLASLDGSGKLPTAQLPDLAVSDYLGTVASQAAMLALTGEKGDWCNRTDTGTVFVISGSTPSSIGSWTQLNYPTAPVTTVAGRTGAVVIVSSDLADFASTVRATVLTGLSLVTSTAITAADSVLAALGKLQAQITLRATLASPTFTGTPAAPAVAATVDSTQIATTAMVQAVNNGSGAYVDVAVTAAANYNVAPATAQIRRLRSDVYITAFTGTATLTLQTTNAQAGDEREIVALVPAGNTGMLEIRNATNVGTLLATVPVNAEMAQVWLLRSRYNGTVWSAATVQYRNTPAAVSGRFAAMLQREGVSNYPRGYQMQIGNGGIPTVGASGDFTALSFVRLKSVYDGTNYGRLFAPTSSGITIMSLAPILGTSYCLSFYNGVIAPNDSRILNPGASHAIGVRRVAGVMSFCVDGEWLVAATGETTDYLAQTALGNYSNNSAYGPFDGVLARPMFFNYALTDAEVVALINRGLVTLPEQRGGSMTSTAQASRSFSYGAADANNTTDISVDAVTASAVAGARTGGAGSYILRFAQDATTAGRSGIIGLSAGVSTGQKARVSFWYRSTTGVTGSIGPRLLVPYGGQAVGLSLLTPTGTWQYFSEEVTATLGSASWLVFTWVSNGGSVGDSIDIDDVSLLPLGTLFELDSGQRSAGYMIRDTSGNGRHVELPASGVEIIDPDATGQITYTRVFGGSGGYIIGDRVVIPEGYFIASVFATGNGTVSLGESAGSASTVCAGATVTSIPTELPVLVTVTSNRKLYVGFGTATTVTFTINLKKL